MNINKIKKLVRGFNLDTDVQIVEKHTNEYIDKYNWFYFTPSENGDHLLVTIWKENVEDDVLPQIYRSFVIAPDRTLFRFAASDGANDKFTPGGFGGFTPHEVFVIMSIINEVEH